MAKERGIFDGQDDTNVEEIRINEKFAKKYHEKKRHEEIQNLKHVDLSDDDGDESDSETEDEDGDHLTLDLDKDISRTLKLIRKKDPSIYDNSITFFQAPESDEEDSEKTKEKKSKPLYYKDLVRQQVLAGDVGDSESEDDHKPVTTYAEEQQKIKGDFLKSLADAEHEEEDELDGGLFMKREKTADEKEEEERDYAEFKKAHDNSEENLDADEFLAKYMKSGAWKERRQVPRYEEIVGENPIDDDEDEDELDKADAFEHAYNFRFEEDGGGHIQSFSRNIDDSLRRKDDKRKIAREERKARKALERQKKEEELRRLKNLKQVEIQSKLDKVVALMGEGHERLTVADIDGDFDPEEHDRRMAQVFDDDYYGVGEENKKPTWNDDDEIFGKLPEEEEEEEDEADEDENEGDDAGNDANLEESVEEPDSTVDEEVDEEEIHDEEDMPMTKEEMEAKKKEYLDELYSLDYEDLIGDLPCRFKYRQVPKNNYGLSTYDILHADDVELKSVVSLKRLAPYVDREYSVDRRKVQQLHKQLRKKENSKKKKKQPETETNETPTEETKEKEENQPSTDTTSKKKRKRKTKSNSNEPKEEKSNENESIVENKPEKQVDEITNQPSKKKRKHKKKATSSTPTAPVGISASRLESYRLKPLK